MFNKWEDSFLFGITINNDNNCSKIEFKHQNIERYREEYFFHLTKLIDILNLRSDP